MTGGKHSRAAPVPTASGPSPLQAFISGRAGARNLKLVLWATSFAVVIVLALVGFLAWRGKTTDTEPWFASYVDVTVSPAYPFAAPVSDTAKNVVLAFIVADPANPCVPHWGIGYSLDEAGRSLNLDANLTQLRKRGGHAAVSFGGATNTELASSCTNLPSLQEAYLKVITRYRISTVDFDIEGSGLSDSISGNRRAQAVAHVQAQRLARGKALDVWLTLPASPHGLTDDGVAQVESMLKAGVDLAGVNIMTMNYGDSRLPGQSMLQASEEAARATQSQLGIIYQRAGQDLDNQAAWAKIGLTPMIGSNEIASDIFDLEAARQFTDFAVANKVGRMSMWSANRDIQCKSDDGGASPGAAPTAASHTCSGVSQTAGAFGEVLGAPFKGTIK